jgi:hypothetical protein
MPHFQGRRTHIYKYPHSSDEENRIVQQKDIKDLKVSLNSLQLKMTKLEELLKQYTQGLAIHPILGTICEETLITRFDVSGSHNT